MNDESILDIVKYYADDVDHDSKSFTFTYDSILSMCKEIIAIQKPSINELFNIIREVDENNSLGAGALTERIYNSFYKDNQSNLDYSTNELEKCVNSVVSVCADIVKHTRWQIPPSQEQIANHLMNNVETILKDIKI